MLATLLVVAVLSGTIVLAGGASGGQNPKKEAQRLARWLEKIIVTASRTGYPFTFVCGNSGSDRKTQETVRILRSDGKQEDYASAYGCRFIRPNPGENVWSPQWGTFTPAFTVRVTNGRKTDDHYVVVSTHGRVRTSASPPR